MTDKLRLKKFWGLCTLYFIEMYKARQAEIILVCLKETWTWQQERENKKLCHRSPIKRLLTLLIFHKNTDDIFSWNWVQSTFDTTNCNLRTPGLQVFKHNLCRTVNLAAVKVLILLFFNVKILGNVLPALAGSILVLFIKTSGEPL